MWGMLGAACILLSGMGPPPTPYWGRGAALGCLREADCLGAVGGRGASGLGRCRLPQAPFLRGSAPSAPRGRGGRAQGAGRRLGCCSRRGGCLPVSRALPTCISAFCRLFTDGRPRPAPFWPG